MVMPVSVECGSEMANRDVVKMVQECICVPLSSGRRVAAEHEQCSLHFFERDGGIEFVIGWASVFRLLRYVGSRGDVDLFKCAKKCLWVLIKGVYQLLYPTVGVVLGVFGIKEVAKNG
ncbi:hypothetical protein HPB48_015457 [Haemaphysalis longicornis]|uniref:Uncharacterized protein n=1 Tax=Haemaphysalis longicornis TaxID=44386 RepID=A0A9J6FZ09_HAELO|nr:hypothetical protein HPB48_015457 [Haemaphysalis longicornis]